MKPLPGPNTVEVFTDGACQGNPGPGGWAAILRYRGIEKELSGAEPMTTNNRMEMIAAIMALDALKRPSSVRLATDSRYLKDGITGWIHRWKLNGWKTADKKPVKNADLWQRLESALERHRVSFDWVRGHAGHLENARADALAGQAIRDLLAAGAPPAPTLPRKGTAAEPSSPSRAASQQPHPSRAAFRRHLRVRTKSESSS